MGLLLNIKINNWLIIVEPIIVKTIFETHTIKIVRSDNVFICKKI